MADLVSCIVDVDAGGGHDYTSLNAAEADNFGATGSSLVANDEYVECECKATSGSADTTAVLVGPFTTDPTHDILINTIADRHSGVWSNSIYRLAGPDGSDAFSCNVHYITVDGLQISGPSNGETFRIGTIGSYLEVNITNNILKGDGSSGREVIRFNNGTDGESVTNIWNNICYDVPAPNAFGIILAYGTHHVYNNTIFNCDTGIRAYRATATFIAINNIVQGDTDLAFQGTFDGSSDYNLTDGEEDTGGDNDVTGYTVTFEDEDADDFHLDASEDGAIEGADLSGTFTTDIDGDTRSDWDVGADEIIAAADENIFTRFPRQAVQEIF